MDTFSKKKRSEIMSRIRSTNTGPELTLRRNLWGRGLRYRTHYGKEKIDVAFPRRRVAVFIDGCFWHMCPKHRFIPKSNRDYWIPKLTANVRRARRKDARLRRKGWRILHIWEHELKEPDRAASRVLKALGSTSEQSETK
jgi:DNA mismatch endonuclease (patch repair protein)